MVRLPCKGFLKGTCTNSFREKWHLPECLFCMSDNGCGFGEKCSYAHRQVDEQPSKKCKKNGDKSAVAMLKITRWVPYFRIWSSRSLHRFCGRAQTYWSQSDVFDTLKPCYVMLTLETRIHRLEWFAQVILTSVTPLLQNLRICLRKSRNGKSDVPVKQRGGWLKASSNKKRSIKLHSSHLRKNKCLPALTLKPEEREFVVDSGASMHMISKKDLSEMDTLTKSCSPAIVITANGEVQTHEEATVYVKELDIFLTMKVLENTPAVLSPGKLCDENGYSYEWINGQKPHLIKDGIRIICNTENFVLIVVPGLSTTSSSSSYHSTWRTLSRQQRHCSTSSSSSSSSPTTTSSDNETREREDRTENDTPPLPVSSFNVDDRTEKPVVGRESNHEPVHQANHKFSKTSKKRRPW